MNQLRRAQAAYREMSRKVANETGRDVNMWLEKVKLSLGAQYLPNWYQTYCPLEVPDQDAIVATLGRHSIGAEEVRMAIKL